MLYLGLYLSSINVTAEPVVDISVIPEEPEPLDTLTFTATVTSDEDIDEVNLIIKECKYNPDLCFKRTIVPMMLDGKSYQAEYELEYSDATYISYYLEIISGDYTNDTEQINLTLKIDSSNENTNEADSDDEDKSPGFEIIIFIAAVLIIFILIRKKR